MALAAATRLGPYEILGLIGSGGMGEVYKAKDTRLDRTVAIKVLPSEISSDPDRRARFEREAKTIATLSHPHICTLYDVGEHASSLFLVLEHLEGQTLADRLHRGALSIEQALEIGAQIAEALSAAHRAGIIHRDLKPANVMLTKSGVKLLDFGLAKLAPQADAIPGVSAITHSKPLTAQRMIVGTLQYMAPEQLEAKEVDARTDIWALGLVLYEMVTGKAAFAANSEAGLIAAILERQPSPLTSIQPLTPGSLQRLVVRCLAKNPDQRWDSTHDVADELRWIAGAGTADAHVPVAPVHSRLRRVALLLGVVVMVTGAAALWLTGVGRFAPAASPIRSIAVLPLENLSHDEAQEFFTDGLTDALITELGHIKALRVISRTSVMRYKNTRKTVAEISNELNGVGAFLEGTVMRAGDRVAITIQLVDAARDQQLWSQSYERSVSDILGLRREIAQTVAHEIRIATAGDQGSARGVRKVNPAAYEQYLRAITAESAGDTEQTARRALAAAREAVRLDPGFALAYAALSEANGKLWWYHWDHSSARAEEARGAADRALELDADSGEAHRAKGAVYYFIDLNYAKALAEFNAALERNPNDSIALSNIGYVQRRQGRQDEAVRTLEQAIQLNPVDATLFFNLGETYALVRRPEDADRSYDRAIALSSYSRPFAYKLRWRLRVRPEFKEAREIERRAESAGFGADPILMYHRVMLHIFSGDSRTSLQLLAASGVEAFEEQFWYVPRTLLQGQAYEAIGDRLQARASYAEARRLLTEKLAHDWQDSRYHSALGVVLAALGDAPGALREGKAGTDLMPVTREAYRGVYRLEDLARIYALTGQRDAAVETLRRVLTIPDDLSAAGVLIDPAFERLRGYPPFENLIASPSRRSGQFSESLELVRGTEAKVPGK